MAEVDWHRLPPLSTLRAFEATARLKGYSAAARSLNVTPAAIAQQVRKLEVEMGTSLVRREGRGLTLTGAGRRLAAPLREAFGIIANGVDDTRRAEATRGVRVSTTHFFVDAVILPRLGDFWAQHSDVQVTFSPDGNQQPVDLDNFDISVRGDDTGKSFPGFASHHLLTSPIVLVAAPSLLEKAKGDLTTLPWIYEHSMGIDNMYEFARRSGFDADSIDVVDPGSAKFEIEATLMGYGLSICTELVVKPHLDAGRLVRMEVPFKPMASYAAITRKGPLPKTAQLFLDWLVGVCAAHDTRPGA